MSEEESRGEYDEMNEFIGADRFLDPANYDKLEREMIELGQQSEETNNINENNDTSNSSKKGEELGGLNIVPQIQNTVSTVNLSCRLPLKEITLKARNAEYNPKRFAAAILRIREPRTTALVFSSGKMVVTGARSEEQSKLAARKYARIIQKLGYPVKFVDFRVQNIVGSVDVGFPVRLEGLVSSHSQFCSYEPELFPGLVYRMIQPRLVLLIFVSGKMVLTGAKKRQEIYDAFENIYPILTTFKK